MGYGKTHNSDWMWCVFADRERTISHACRSSLRSPLPLDQSYKLKGEGTSFRKIDNHSSAPFVIYTRREIEQFSVFSHTRETYSTKVEEFLSRQHQNRPWILGRDHPCDRSPNGLITPPVIRILSHSEQKSLRLKRVETFSIKIERKNKKKKRIKETILWFYRKKITRFLISSQTRLINAGSGEMKNIAQVATFRQK